MKMEVKAPKVIDVVAVSINAAVRYEEEDMPNDFPGRKGDMWNVTVNIETGALTLDDGTPFPADITKKLCMKVTDCGNYYLVDANGITIAAREDNYVPDFFPGDHYGDYIQFHIEGGRVTNWAQPDAGEVNDAFFADDE